MSVTTAAKAGSRLDFDEEHPSQHGRGLAPVTIMKDYRGRE